MLSEAAFLTKINATNSLILEIINQWYSGELRIRGFYGVECSEMWSGQQSKTNQSRSSRRGMSTTIRKKGRTTPNSPQVHKRPFDRAY